MFGKFNGFRDSVKQAFRSTNPETQKELKTWLEEVIQIHSNSELSPSEKEKQVSQIRTSEPLMLLLKTLLEMIIYKVPGNKSVLKAGVAGVGIAATIVTSRFSWVTLLILKNALPKLVLSNKFQEFSEFLLRELNEESTQTSRPS